MASISRSLSKRLSLGGWPNEKSAPSDTDSTHSHTHAHDKDWKDVIRLLAKDAKLREDVCDPKALLDALENANTKGLDDRDLLLEKAVHFMSAAKELPISQVLQQGAINLLYKDLPHPPSAYLSLPSTEPRKISEEEQAREQARIYAFRTADGYNTNILNPTMGQAGTPYARSVPAINFCPKAGLPDPGLVFDSLLKRDEYKPHPGGISALFFAFADLVIHSIFNTDHFDGTLNNTSSYLDLSVLYGNSEKDVNSVRRNDGTGKLLDDVFADPRLLFMPPASCALLILLNRNHNYIAQRILDINENGNYQNPPPTDEKARKDQDDEIFHRSRLVNCGYFMKIILGDYVGAILGLVRDGSDWRLDPLSTYRGLDHDLVPTGQGNVVSVEFNLLYRWHATLSEPDTKWTTNMLKGIFDADDAEDFDFKNVTPNTFKLAAHKYLIPSKPVQEWEFNGLKRVDGRFRDEDLAKILLDATEARASAFKARGIPEALRVIEVMAINQSRNWGACSLNEFRKFLGLKPYESFSAWNSNKDIAKTAEALYRDIDNLELHVGLQAEEPKQPRPGAGLCPGYTISRAILADAVALTRGDRFMTVDFTPHNLTSWGFQDCQYDTKDGSYGGMLTKLLFRTLPDYYPRGSAYAHFPFLEPKFMRENLKDVDASAVSKYTWDRPKAPLYPTATVYTFGEVQRVLSDKTAYLSASDGRLFEAVKPTLLKKSEMDEAKYRRDSDAASIRLLSGAGELSKHIFKKPDGGVAAYFAEKTAALMKDKSFSTSGSGGEKYVDVVKDVINLLPAYWLSEKIGGFPLKKEGDPNVSDVKSYEKFADIASFVYLNFGHENDWRLREESQEYCKKFIECVANTLSGRGHHPPTRRPFSLNLRHFNLGFGHNDDHAFLDKLWADFGKGKTTPHEFAAHVVAAVVPTAALYSQAVATVVNYYLDGSQQVNREAIIRLADSKEQGARDEIMKYVYEALRLDPPVAGVYRTATKDDVLAGVRVNAGQAVFASIADACLDASVFGDEPSVASYQRSLKDYSITNFGAEGFLTPEFLSATVPAVLSAIFNHKNLQRGPSKSGVFTRFVEKFHGVERTQYLTHKGLVSQYPDSLIVGFAQ